MDSINWTVIIFLALVVGNSIYRYFREKNENDSIEIALKDVDVTPCISYNVLEKEGGDYFLQEVALVPVE